MPARRQELLLKLAKYDKQIDDHQTYGSHGSEYDAACRGFDRTLTLVLEDLIREATKCDQLATVLRMCADNIPSV
jgi:hypothetical protein